MLEGGLQEPRVRSKEEDLCTYSLSVVVLTRHLDEFFNINNSSSIILETIHYDLHHISHRIILFIPQRDQ